MAVGGYPGAEVQVVWGSKGSHATLGPPVSLCTLSEDECLRVPRSLLLSQFLMAELGLMVYRLSPVLCVCWLEMTDFHKQLGLGCILVYL